MLHVLGPAKVCIELDTDSEESSLDQTVHYSQADFSGPCLFDLSCSI